MFDNCDVADVIGLMLLIADISLSMTASVSTISLTPSGNGSRWNCYLFYG